LPAHPDSVPINQLVQVPGTPLAGSASLDPFEFVRTIAVARITMPRSMVRLSAGREAMSDELQAMCFMAAATSIVYGEPLLTTPRPGGGWALALFAPLGLRPMPRGGGGGRQGTAAGAGPTERRWPKDPLPRGRGDPAGRGGRGGGGGAGNMGRIDIHERIS